MPSISPPLPDSAQATLEQVGAAIRDRRKALRISATAAAEAAKVSRVTLHRIEKGEPSVTIGAYLAACAALGLQARVAPREQLQGQPGEGRTGWIPARVRIADYPRLAELAWQLQTGAELSPREALDIYERNWKHVDPRALGPEEGDLVQALRDAFGGDVRV